MMRFLETKGRLRYLSSRMEIDTLIDKILDSYETLGGINRAGSEDFPNRQNVERALDELMSLVFPGFKVAEEVSPSDARYVTGRRLNNVIALLTNEIQKVFVYTMTRAGSEKGAAQNSRCFKLAERAALSLAEEIPEIRRKIMLDAEALLRGDPAAKTLEEVILSYPGLEAILAYRVAHFLAESGVPMIPRIMSERAHGKTGIDINPCAKIGESFFIDHGTGVVVGETCVIGNNVKIYQGVTLGALSVKKEMKGVKRHPTIEDDVTIYAGATILGGSTVIGKGSVIGGNTWITSSVPPGAFVTNGGESR